MKARSKRTRKTKRTLTDGKRAAAPLPISKLRTDAPAKRAPVAKWFNRQQVHRGKPKPWFRVPPEQLKTHQQKRAIRAAERMMEKWAGKVA